VISDILVRLARQVYNAIQREPCSLIWKDSPHRADTAQGESSGLARQMVATGGEDLGVSCWPTYRCKPPSVNEKGKYSMCHSSGTPAYGGDSPVGGPYEIWCDHSQ
jgi:hypothetical protein